MSDRLQTQFSQVSIDAEPWAQQDSGQTGQRRRDDPSGAIPRSGVRQPQMATIPQTEQLYTGRETKQTACSPSWESMSREEFIHKYYDKLPKELKVPYFDVMLLYSEDDREEAEKFRQHLENDIFPDEPGKIKAVLYDGSEYEGLSTSKLQHLEHGFKRSTFTFVYLTKKFVDCDWCALSSETCLIEAIYNTEKKWCVVPVYTVQRNKADFRIPMGLNSLKGINFYNPDEFYRKGVRRLIGDKIIKREENEKKREQDCYDYLKKKVLEEHLEEQRKETEHLRNMQRYQSEQQRAIDNHYRMMSRSQSEQYSETQEARHMMYFSGQPKTAGALENPNFPSQYQKVPSEQGDYSSIQSVSKPEWMPKYDIQQETHTSMPSSMNQPSAKHSAKPSDYSMPHGEPSSLDSSHLSNDYFSAPHNSHGPNSRENYQSPHPAGKPTEVHYHYHYGSEKQQEASKTYNINAGNVIIGEHGKIYADGKHFTDTDNMEERPSRSSNDNEDGESSNLNERHGSGIAPSTVYPDNGYSTGHSNTSSYPRQSKPIEHSEETTNIKQLPPNIPPDTKETVTYAKSAALDKYPPENISKIVPVISGMSMTGKGQSDELNQNISTPDVPNIPVSVVTPQKSSPLSSQKKPIKPFLGKPNVTPVAQVKPARRVDEQSATAGNDDTDVAGNDDTDVKKPYVSHQTTPKVTNTASVDDETELKTSGTTNNPSSTQTSPSDPLSEPRRHSQSITEQSNTFAPDSCHSEETEVLKPVKKGSTSSLETDGCARQRQSSGSSPVLSEADLKVKAVNECLSMGYTDEQVHDALVLLKETAEKHGHQRHHFNIHEMLDALNGKTSTYSSNNPRGDYGEDSENWVTIKKEEQFGESEESLPMEEKSQSSKTVKKSSSDSKLNSQKPKTSKKDGCKMS